MIERLQAHSVPIVIAVAFFVTGFFGVAGVLTLSAREVVLGLIAGGVGGLCVLVAVVLHDGRAAQPRDRAGHA